MGGCVTYQTTADVNQCFEQADAQESNGVIQRYSYFKNNAE